MPVILVVLCVDVVACSPSPVVAVQQQPKDKIIWFVVACLLYLLCFVLMLLRVLLVRLLLYSNNLKIKLSGLW